MFLQLHSRKSILRETVRYLGCIILDSIDDRIVFDIMNQFSKVSFEEMGHYFESGYSTKETDGKKRGIGLCRAKTLIEKANGEITVGQQEIEGNNYIHFQVTV